METRGIVASWTTGREELEIVVRRRSRCTRPATSSPATCRSPRATSASTARDVGGGFGQKMFVYREECAVVLASRLLGRPVKWIEDRRENLIVGRPLPQRVRHTCGWPSTTTASSRPSPSTTSATSAPTRSARRSSTRCCCPGRTRSPRLGFSIDDGVDQHHGQGRLPRAVDVRDDRARDGHRPRRRARSASTPSSCAVATCCAFDDLPFTVAERQRVPGDHPARDARAGARDARLRGVPQGAGRGAAPRAGYLGVGICVYVEPTSMGAPHACHRGATVRSRRAARSSRTSAPRRTARASRPRWRRSSPSTSACRLRRRHHRAGRHRSRRPTAPAPAGAAPRSSPAARRARRPWPCARR